MARFALTLFSVVMLCAATGCSRMRATPTSGNGPKATEQLAPVESLSVSSDGKTCAAAFGSRVKLFDLTTASMVKEIPAHEERISCVQFSPDGKRLVTGGDDLVLKIWDVTTGELACTLEGHRSPLLALAWSPDGKTIAAAAGDYNPYVGDKRSGDPKMANRVRTELLLWDAETGKKRTELKGHGRPISGLAFLPTGETLISCDRSCELRIWDCKAGKQTNRLDLAQPEAGTNGIVISPDGKTAALPNFDHSIWLLDTSTWKEKTRLKGHQDRVLTVAFNQAGDRLVSGGDDRSVIAWDLATAKPVATLQGHRLMVLCVGMGSDHGSAVSGGRDGKLIFWDLAKNAERQTPR